VALFPATLRVTKVRRGGPADQTGLEDGDLLLGVIARGRFGERELPLHSRVDLARLCREQRGKDLKIIVLRGDRDLVGTIKIAE